VVGFKIVPEPTGTRGYDDLRRAATRGAPSDEAFELQSPRPTDLARMLAAGHVP
jgi:hypothetical protein